MSGHSSAERAPSATPESISLSALNHHLYCARRAYLIHAEHMFVDNEHTILGQLAHEAVDHPGYEHRAGWELLRALPLYSDTLGLSGKADLVEILRAPDASVPIVDARPVEYKKGTFRRWSNDQVQLCAQAFCLEEMFSIRIASGLVYHAASAKREEVIFDAPLRALTLSTLDALRATLTRTIVPAPILTARCDGCSLREICLPEAADRSAYSMASLFEPRDYA